MALGVLLIHWLLLFVWGLGFNDSGHGYLYCRIAMPSIGAFKPWLLSLAILALLTVLGTVDRRYLTLDSRIAYWPIPLFIATQLFALWLNETSVRY